MKRDETPLLPDKRQTETRQLGERIAQMRHGLKLRQADAAAHAPLAPVAGQLLQSSPPSRNQRRDHERRAEPASPVLPV
ncbi:hypothetical protein AL472_25295 [Bordetella bronchiseptica]|nr:hypothetical protein AL472_25295 [Bordetella bronchiseptica]